MPQHIKAIVITGNGTNCEMEMAHACRLAGFGPSRYRPHQRTALRDEAAGRLPFS